MKWKLDNFQLLYFLTHSILRNRNILAACHFKLSQQVPQKGHGAAHVQEMPARAMVFRGCPGVGSVGCRPGDASSLSVHLAALGILTGRALRWESWPVQ